MRVQRTVITAATAIALGASVAAVAQGTEPAIVPVERIFVQPANPPHGPYHGGYVTERDAELLSAAVGALDSDRRMDGATVTMVANQGELVVNGTTTGVTQAWQIESTLRRLPGATRVTAWFDSPGA